MSHDQQTYRRATATALTGLAVQVVLTVAMSLIGIWAHNAALHAAALHLLGGLPIWIFLWLLYNQHRIERIESLEAEQLARSDAGTAALFDEHGDDLNLAQRRLRNLYKWGLGIVSLVVSVYLMALGGVWLYLNTRAEHTAALDEKADEKVLLGLCAGIAFVAFVVARYVAGMTQVREWLLLRGGASYLMGNALVAVLAMAAAFGRWMQVPRVFDILAIVVPALMVLVGIEILFTFLLGAYRPRRPGEVPRPAFDSRALGLLTSPESIAKAISDTINYQFGFEISRSWFYQLLARAIMPLVVFALAVLVLISSVVVVEPHERAVISRCGAFIGIVEPGIHIKMPWPISRAEKYPVDRIHEIEAGSLEGHIDTTKAILWTTPHTAGEEQYLITGGTRVAGREDGAVLTAGVRGMALVAANVLVQFRIREDGLKQFVQNATEPKQLIASMEQRQRWAGLVERWEAGGRQGGHPLVGRTAIDPCPLLSALAARRVSTYFAQHEIDTLLAKGRREAGQKLHEAIQEDVDSLQLGLEIVFVGLAGIHPPQAGDVASAFHEQISALQENQSEIEKAQRYKIGMLARVGGSQENAEAIYAEISGLEQMRRQPAADGAGEAIEAGTKRINQMLRAARGQATEVLYEADTYRWDRVITERAKANRFLAMLGSYERAPEYYPMRLYFDVLAEGLAKARKIVVPSVGVQQPEIRFDLEEHETGLGGILSER